MKYQEAIDNALAAHGAWKRRLNDAIERGSSQFQVHEVQEDNRCDFGNWFYALPEDLRRSSNGREVQELHATFHVEAAGVLRMALAGKKKDALEALASSSRYSLTSGKLALALTRWKSSLAGR